MTYFPVVSPFEIFFDLDGNSLEDGYIYIGEANQNPITNQITVYWDSTGLYPAAQPIRTIDGYPDRNGSPAKIYVNAGAFEDYSILINDKHGRLVFYAQSARFDDIASGNTVNLIDDLRSISGYGQPIYVRGHTTIGDGGQGIFEWFDGAVPGTYVDDNGITIVPTGGDGGSAWIRSDINGMINILWYGPYTDNTNPVITTAALNSAKAVGGEVFIPNGEYSINADINLNFQALIGENQIDTILNFNNSNGIVLDGVKAIIKNLTIKNAYNSITIGSSSADAGRESIIENVLLLNAQNYSVLLQNGWDNIIRDSKIYGSTSYDIYAKIISGGYINTNYFDNIRHSSCGAVKTINIGSGDLNGLFIRDNIIEGNSTANSIGIGQDSTLTIKGLYVSGCYFETHEDCYIDLEGSTIYNSEIRNCTMVEYAAANGGAGMPYLIRKINGMNIIGNTLITDNYAIEEIEQCYVLGNEARDIAGSWSVKPLIQNSSGDVNLGRSFCSNKLSNRFIELPGYFTDNFTIASTSDQIFGNTSVCSLLHNTDFTSQGFFRRNGAVDKWQLLTTPFTTKLYYNGTSYLVSECPSGTTVTYVAVGKYRVVYPTNTFNKANSYRLYSCNFVNRRDSGNNLKIATCSVENPSGDDTLDVYLYDPTGTLIDLAQFEQIHIFFHYSYTN